MAHFVKGSGQHPGGQTSRISNTIQRIQVGMSITVGVWGAKGLRVSPNDPSIASIVELDKDSSANVRWFQITGRKIANVMVEARNPADNTVWDYFQLAVVREQIAIIVYGDGRELGDFKVFAENLHQELSKKYKKLLIQYVNRDTIFFNLINSISKNEEIQELHIFSHSIGAGLFLGYKDASIAARREAILRAADQANRKVTYLEALTTEVGAIQTDDLKTGKFVAQKNDLQSKFSPSAFIKIWGCNSGVENWVYSDNGVTDPKDTSEPYYWRAFNEMNTPKPSIAKALAKFFNCKVYGARSGASIEVKYREKWISSKQYKNKIGHWPSGSLPYRLIPDKGTYYEYLP